MPPIFGAVVIIPNPRDRTRVLACTRSLNPFTGGLFDWALPGGKLEPGETPIQAAIRECREEAGLDLVAPDLISEPFIDAVVPQEYAATFLCIRAIDSFKRISKEGLVAWRSVDVVTRPSNVFSDYNVKALRHFNLIP